MTSTPAMTNAPAIDTLGCADLYDHFVRIGGGSYGHVYKARHRFLKNADGAPAEVCVKVRKVSTDPATDAELAKYFAREAQLADRLKHPYLPKLLNYFELTGRGADGKPVPLQAMVFDWLEGENLEEFVTKRGPIADEHACWILDRVLDALAYLADGRIVHSDIKPANIILNPACHAATLIDFGMVVKDPVAGTLAVGGTKEYIAPELRDRGAPLPEADMYSLGKTVCFATGGNPMSGDPPADMDPRLARVLDRMTAKHPLDRPKDADALRKELRALRLEVFGRTSAQEAIAFRHP